MKRFVTPSLRNFLLSGPPHPQPIVADCFTLTLVTGDVFRLTSFDWGISIAANPTLNQPGGTFTAMGSYVRRGRIVNKRGFETSTLDITIGPAPDPNLDAGSLTTPPVQTFGMSLSEAAIAGLLYGATVRLETVYGDPVSGGGLTRQSDGTYTDGGWGSLIKFSGLVADIEVHKQELVISCSSLAHYLEPVWPPYLIQYACRWRLFDGGCSNLKTGTGSMSAASPTLTGWSGEPLVSGSSVGRPITVAGAGPAGGNLVTTIVAVLSTTSATLADPAIGAVAGAVVTIGLLASNFATTGNVAGAPASTVLEVYHSLTNPSGWFSDGRIVFLSGQNAGLTRQIRAGIAAGSAGDYVTTVMNDTPYAFYRFNDAVGSPTVADSSGNGHNATVNGTITLGQPTMVPGDPGGAGGLFDGTTGFLTAPVPKPSNFSLGVTFEFWFKLSVGAAGIQPTGIFDTNGSGSLARGFRNNGEPADVRPGFEWGRDRPYIGIVPPTPGTVLHVVVAIYGSDSMDVYINGVLWQTLSVFGLAALGWIPPIWIGKTTAPGPVFFDGTLQDLAIYKYAFSADQAFTHYLSGASAPSPTGSGKFLLLTPLIYAPAPGDAFIAYPGCSKLLRVCDQKFKNRLQYGGQISVPEPEVGL